MLGWQFLVKMIFAKWFIDLKKYMPLYLFYLFKLISKRLLGLTEKNSCGGPGLS